jgi:hypothetical protein
MAFHPYQYEQLVAERHAQIQHDMQLSRAQVHPKQRAHAQPPMGKLNTRLQELGAQQQQTEQQSQTFLRAS